MKQPAHRILRSCLVWAAAGALAGAAALAPHALSGGPVGKPALITAGLCWGTALGLLVWGWRAARRLGRGIDRLRGAVLNLVADPNAVLPEPDPRTMSPEVLGLLTSLSQFQGKVLQERRGPDQRLVTVLGALRSGVAVITEQGQVTLVNSTGRELLGAERVRVGTSVFAALERGTVLDALARAEAAGAEVEAVFSRLDGVALHGRVSPLPGRDGAVLIFPPVELDEHRPGVDFDLGLHDLPPESEPLGLEALTAELPTLILDCETTGLDAGQDRIVSIGAIRAHGTRLYPGAMIDTLVDPGVPIPGVSTAVHGITDQMVSDARRFPLVCADLRRLARNSVIVGHNVPFDLTILRAECERHGCPWEHPVFLDTMRLAVLLEPDLPRHDLETLAEHYGVAVHGRHTALGDALVTAEIYFRMLPQLRERGLTTLGALLQFHCTEAKEVIGHQRRQGWITTQSEQLRRP